MAQGASEDFVKVVLRQANSISLDWVKSLKRNQTVCELEDGIFCDESERDHYRNKSEFTIGMTSPVENEETGEEVSEIAIGYALGLSREGDFRVGKVTEKFKTTSLLSMRVANAITQVVKSSGQPVYDRRKHIGYWRQLTVRESMRIRSVIVMVMVCKDGIVESDFGMNDAKCRQAVVDVLREELGEEYEFGVYWQHSTDLTPMTANVPAEHVNGLKVLTESLSGLQFAVDPAAFFQSHTPVTERLYKLIGEYAGVTKQSTLLDVCCGTGTIGLTLAGQARSVIGVDMDGPWGAWHLRMTSKLGFIPPVSGIQRGALRTVPCCTCSGTDNRRAAQVTRRVFCVNTLLSLTQVVAQAVTLGVTQAGAEEALNEVQVEEIASGSGPSAVAGSRANVRWVLRRSNGYYVSSNSGFNNRFEELTYTVGSGSLIAGFEQGMAGIKAGGRRHFIVPASLGYMKGVQLALLVLFRTIAQSDVL